jgi:hypothetical protein
VLVYANQVSVGSGAVTRMTVSTSVLLAATDYVAMGVRHNAGGAINLTAETYAPRFGCIRRLVT